MRKRIFVTGISTEVGKTLAAAILVEALQADYWKPVQAGDLEHSDSHKVADLISNKHTRIHPNAFALNTPMSPHAAAEIDDVQISLDAIKTPETDNFLVVEGAGGLLVPLNDRDVIADLIQAEDLVVVVSRHYLGSINHTLLSLGYLKEKGHNCCLLYSGDAHPSTEEIIHKMGGVPVIGRIDEASNIDQGFVKSYAAKFLPQLESLVSA